ncbi:MAG: hypothetical protein AAFP26_03345 [Planctomycetota bacterium]
MSEPALPARTFEASHPRGEVYRRWALEITSIPTVAGREERVEAWIDAWLAERDDLAVRRDAHGNTEVRFADMPEAGRAPDGPHALDPNAAPIYFTAHLDHPAFVVHEPNTDHRSRATLEFRGGVMEAYFKGARVRIDPDDGAAPVEGAIVERIDPEKLAGTGVIFPRYTIALDAPADLAGGEIAAWALDPSSIEPDEFGGLLHAPACDDLAALAAAICALEELRFIRRGDASAVGDVRLLLTRSEEIGFIGAIGASRDRFMPAGSRVIALENSRSFPGDSPIHGGPIVRVGDRVSVFTPELTSAVADVAERLAGGSAHMLAIETKGDRPWKWQRKLMPGGACEASVFCAYGYDSTCVCLPLGNYHNMAGLSEMQAGTHQGRPRIAREYVGVDDYCGMIDLLVACGTSLASKPAFRERVEKLWTERSFVLDR